VGVEHRDWSIEVPMNRRVTFSADQYDAEVRRVGADHSWETAERTAGRLVLRVVNRDALQKYGLTPSWVANDHRNAGLFRVALQLDDTYQVFVDLPWRDRTPEQLIRELCAIERPPYTWHAAGHAFQAGTNSGLSTEIHMCVGGKGRPLAVLVGPGQGGDAPICRQTTPPSPLWRRTENRRDDRRRNAARRCPGRPPTAGRAGRRAGPAIPRPST
jgi:hypothetical protein